MNSLPHRLLARFCILLSLSLAFPSLAEEKTDQSFTIKFSADTPVTYRSGKKADDQVPIYWRYSYKAWTLMGEPVQDCILQWSLAEGQKFKLYNSDTKSWVMVSPPNEILRKTSLSIDTVRVNISPSTAISCDGGALAKPGITGFLGKPVVKATSSFNSPGSPDWDEFFPSSSMFHAKTGFLPTDEAKKTFKGLRGQKLTPSWFNFRLVDAQLSISGIESWYRKKLAAKREAKKAKQNPPTKTQNKKNAELKKKTSPTKTTTPKGKGQQILNAQAFGMTATDSRLSQSSNIKTTNSKLSLSGNHQASVSGVPVPGEASNTGANNSLLLLIDTSGSMRGTRIQEAKKAAKELIRKASDQKTEVAVLTFSGECSAPVPKHISFSTNRGQLLAFVDSLSTGGGTPMSAAVEYANVYMANNRSRQSNSEMILLLADGDDGCGIMSPVVSTLKKEGILYRHQTVGLELNHKSSAVKDLKMVAEASGGDYSSAASASQLSETFENAAIAMGILNLMGKYNQPSSSQKTSANDQQRSIFNGFGE